MRSERFTFPNATGEQLAATLDWPLGKPTAFALFAHCFTCGKDNLAAKRIAERLTIHGIAVLRFDFTGLGGSEGEFANTHFSSNLDDLVAAADHLRKTATRAGDPDRPQPRRLGRARRRAPHRRGARGGDHRRALRSRACHRPVQAARRHDQGERRARGAAGRAAVHDQARIPRRCGGEEAQRVPGHACARRCWCSIRRPTIWSASTTPRTSSSPPSIRKASSRSPAPTIC